MATEIRAGVNKPYAIFMKEAKEGLREKGRIELHGLGDSITNVIRAAEMLTNQGYADLVTFQTSSITSDRDGVSRTKAKVIIVLSKGSDFEKAFEDFEKSRVKRNY
jgi:hypothetical protein